MSATLESKTERPTEQPPAQKPASEGRSLSPMALFFSLLMGVYFGIVLVKSEVVRWERIHAMFLFQEAQMYLIIGVGVVVAMISMLWIKAVHARGLDGEEIRYQPKPWHWGVPIGGTLFGAGWAITGACPGPIYAQIGGGVWPAWFTLAGALAGMSLYALLKPRLPH